jgi:hypothetical protein
MSVLTQPMPAKPERVAMAASAGLAARPPAGPDLQAMLSYYLLRDLEQEVVHAEQALSNPNGPPLDAGAIDPRRQLARQLVIGAWLNRNNPNWDPLVPESHCPDPQDPLVAVLASVANGVSTPLAAQAKPASATLRPAGPSIRPTGPE